MLARATRGQRCAPASRHGDPALREVLGGRALAAAHFTSPITAADSRVKVAACSLDVHGWARQRSKGFLMNAGGVKSASGQYR